MTFPRLAAIAARARPFVSSFVARVIAKKLENATVPTITPPDVQLTRAELDELRKLARVIEGQHELLRRIAGQLNQNTVMMKRWLEGSPELQAIEKQHALEVANPPIILPPKADLRVIPPTQFGGRSR